MADHQKIYAVLTGDLIKSFRLTSTQSKGAKGWTQEEAAKQWPIIEKTGKLLTR